MKRLLILFISVIFFYANLYAQKKEIKIDTANYYDYEVSPVKDGFIYAKDPANVFKLQGKIISTNWLRSEEVIIVIAEELKNAGYQTVLTNALYQTNDSKYMVVTALVEKPRFGILYIDGHYGIINVKQRNGKENLHSRKLNDGSTIYWQSGYSANDSFTMEYSKMPPNFLLLFENCYWYQYTDNDEDNKYLVNRNKIVEILRKDIRSLLKTAPKPIKESSKTFFFKHEK
ncbi:hypothetical protein [Mucilaginibacter aquariorum]|uniref:Uncharacterized protein n=1 Tax=Mucilaginibacter aquariorum TaxID=2967225 RepID=A0ABT1T1T0_9SPHI|nr:hypothetical protein [Mucilaginibacter aquariorum]MCQ6958512.1 hypothetical protein [Mucilaginibacter aquariorum]